MYFNASWSTPIKFDSGRDSADIIGTWGCKGKAGIYVISDEFDSQILYVGKAEGTSRDIYDRLKSHLTDDRSPGSPGNKGVGRLVNYRESENDDLLEI